MPFTAPETDLEQGFQAPESDLADGFTAPPEDVGEATPAETPVVGKLESLWNSARRGMKAAAGLPDVLLATGTEGMNRPTIRQERLAYERAMKDPKYADALLAAGDDRDKLLTVEARRGPFARLEQTMAVPRTIQRETVADVAKSQAEIQAIPQSPAQKQLGAANTAGDKWKAWLHDPVELTAGIVLESLPPSVAGAAVGSVVGGPGVGTAAGVGLSSGVMTFSGEFLDNARKQGVDVANPDALQAFIEDEGAFNQAFSQAMAKASAVAGVDAATAGAAGQFIGPALKKGLRDRIVATGKEVALQAAGGAGGEAAGQILSGQKLDPFDIAMEALAEVASGPAEVMSNLTEGKSTGKSDSGPASAAQPGVQTPTTPPMGSEPGAGVAPSTAPGLSSNASKVREQMMKLPGAGEDLGNSESGVESSEKQPAAKPLTPEERAQPMTRGDAEDLQRIIRGNQLKPVEQPSQPVEAQRRGDAEAQANAIQTPPDNVTPAAATSPTTPAQPVVGSQPLARIEEQPEQGLSRVQKPVGDVAAAILRTMDSLKVDMNGKLHAFGLLPEMWNQLIEFVKLGVRAGRSLRDAISWGVDKLKSNHPDVSFDEAGATDYLMASDEAAPMRQELGEIRRHGKIEQASYVAAEIKDLLTRMDGVSKDLERAKAAGYGVKARDLGAKWQAMSEELAGYDPEAVRRVTRGLIQSGVIGGERKLLLRSKSRGSASEYLGGEKINPVPAAEAKPAEAAPAVDQPSAETNQPPEDVEFNAQKDRFKKRAGVNAQVQRLRKLIAGPETTTARETPGESSGSGLESPEELQRQLSEAMGYEAAVKQARSATRERLAAHKHRVEQAGALVRRARRSPTAELMRQVQKADDWLAADAEQIRKSLMDLAAHLPPEERAKFTGLITTSMRRPRVLSAHPEVMYERASRAAAEIESHIEAFQSHEERAANIRSWLKTMMKELPMTERGRFLNAFAVAMRNPTSKFTGKLLADLQAHIENVQAFDERAETIREKLQSLLKELPVEERGRFAAPLAAAMRQPTSKYAAKVFARIEKHIEDVYRWDTIQQIRKVADRALASPTVDLKYKRMLSHLLHNVATDAAGEVRVAELARLQQEIDRMKALGAEVFVPEAIQKEIQALAKNRLTDLPTDAIEALLMKVVSIEKIGRQANASRIALFDRKRLDIEQDLYTATTNPQNERALSDETRMAGTQPTVGDRLADQVATIVNAAANLDRAILPIDALFDVIDGAADGGGPNYKGVLARRFKGTVRLNRQNELVMRDAIMTELEAIRKKHQLTTRHGERIGVYALLKQEGVRERLLAQGETAENLDHIVRSITPGELEFYEAARRLMEAHRPQIAELMHRLYNVELKPEPNYWPLQRDWQKYAKEATPMEAAKLVESGGAGGFDELGTWSDLSPDYKGYLRTKAEQGFTKERTKGKTPVKVNAFEVLEHHFRAVTHLLAHQEDLKILGEVARGDLMRERAGTVGQKIVLDWLDTVARDGRVDGHQRNRALDALRRTLTMGIIPWNPVTMLVHTSQIPVTMSLIGPNWFRRGAMALMTPEGKAFVNAHMRTLTHRAGSEPAISEVQRGGHPIINLLFGSESAPARWMQNYTQAGTWPIRMIDTIHSMTAALGAYQRELGAKGIDPDTYATHPVDQEALGRAMAISHRTVASVLPEDMPQILTRGKSFANKSGNVSFAKTLLQFGNTYLDIWSVIRHDFARVAIPESAKLRNPRAFYWAGSLGLAVAVSVLWEAGIRYGIRQAIASGTGAGDKDDDEYSHELAHEFLKRFPFMGNAMATRYGNTGIPVVDTFVQLGEDVSHRATAKKDGAKARATARVATDIGTVLGVPGASFGGRLLQKSMSDQTTSGPNSRAISDLAKQFNSETPKPASDGYQQLDHWLESGDLARARAEYKKMIAAGYKPSAIDEHYKVFSNEGNLLRPFAGSLARERDFKASLTAPQRALYDQAIQERRDRRTKFLQIKGSAGE